VHAPKTVEREEKGVKLRSTVVDTPGFGDGMNSIEWLFFLSLIILERTRNPTCLFLVCVKLNQSIGNR